MLQKLEKNCPSDLNPPERLFKLKLNGRSADLRKTNHKMRFKFFPFAPLWEITSGQNYFSFTFAKGYKISKLKIKVAAILYFIFDGKESFVRYGQTISETNIIFKRTSFLVFIKKLEH